MSGSKSTRLAAAAAAVLAGLGTAQAVSAATIAQSYVSIQYATNSAFTSGLTTVTSGTAVSIPVGDYFRYGVADLVTNNPNPDFGTAYDLANQANNGAAVAMPATLGLSQFSYQVTSTDTLGTSLTPVLNTSTLQARANLQPNYAFAVSGTGTITGGNIGAVGASISGGVLPPANTETPSNVATLSFFTGATPVYAFRNLIYQANAAGTFTLTTTLRSQATTYFTEASPGSADGSTDPTYTTTGISAADNINTLAPLVITVTSGGTTPVVALSTTNPGGTASGTITVGRVGPGSYTPSTALFSPAITSGFVVANGFVTPDQEAYGLNLTSTLGTQAAINDLVTYLNANASGGTVVARGAATLTAAQTQIFRGLPAIDQIAFISTTPTASSPEYFSFNLSGFAAAFPSDGTFTVNSITAVPEPTSIAGLALGVGGLLASRRKRMA